ncbi:MAG: hypothetical protein AABZ74_03630 [Cyanobacteriota bacterium]
MQSNIEDDNYNKMKKLISTLNDRKMNEASTRHNIIDFVLHDFLAWPKNRVDVEEYINPGFADYILKKDNNEPLLFIEAKKEGVYFELPIPYSSSETSCFISINKLISNENIKSAMYQVRQYCFDTGCEYACITNGHEWIFFRTFEKGKRWENIQAFIIRKLDFFLQEYTKSINILSFTAITENASLPNLLLTSLPKDRNIFYPKEKIASYEHKITPNRLSNTLRPIINHYFGVINDNDTDFMDKCYVSQREYKSTYDGIHYVLQDSLTPYFEQFGVNQLNDTGKGGQLGGKLTKNLKKNRKDEVLVLFGGKGSGKSTFIKRLLYHTPPRWLKEHSKIAIIDLLKIPEDKEVIRKTIWDKLVDQLDTENLMKSTRETLINLLFKDNFDVAIKQDLSGLQKSSESFNLKLNSLITEWKNDKKYCSNRLVKYWNEQNKGVIVVVDNTDQYSTIIQDFCFTSAQEISNNLNCVVLISMREERFYDSKIHGVLDAFQNSGFHISSPKPSDVFKKRLAYTINLLKDSNKRKDYVESLSQEFVRDYISYLEILKGEFSKENSPLNNFLTASAHGDIRLALDLFRSFILSGYTNVDEMLYAGTWVFKIHQVLKPIMIPERYFYEESLSAIPNIFQLRSKRHSSHFTSLRILRKLSNGMDIKSPSYYSLAKLKTYFAETFNMVEDFELNLEILLKHGFVEANNRLDSYSSNVDSLKITNYGLYMVQELAYEFTYLDLVCTDCGIFSEKISNFLTEAAKNEYKLFTRGERLERVLVRLERVNEFIKYLSEEESKEKEVYSLGMPEKEMFKFKIIEKFNNYENIIKESAKKQHQKNIKKY